MTKYTKSANQTAIVTLEAKTGLQNELKEALLILTQNVYKEPGYVEFRLQQSIEKPEVFMIYEIWTDTAGLEHHFSEPHTLDALKKFENLLAEPMKMLHLDQFAPIV